MLVLKRQANAAPAPTPVVGKPAQIPFDFAAILRGRAGAAPAEVAPDDNRVAAAAGSAVATTASSSAAAAVASANAADAEVQEIAAPSTLERKRQQAAGADESKAGMDTAPLQQAGQAQGLG